MWRKYNYKISLLRGRAVIPRKLHWSFLLKRSYLFFLVLSVGAVLGAMPLASTASHLESLAVLTFQKNTRGWCLSNTLKVLIVPRIFAVAP